MLLSLCIALFAVSPAGDSLPNARQTVSGYIRNIPPESTEESAHRHRRIAARRAGPIIIAHRGASAFAPENTLESYAAAMDYGADGCEIDIRRTTDGVLCLFHDDMLDHLTHGFGAVNEITYPELLALRPMYLYGTARPDTRPPTFAALLTLARQRAMLLHLDVKEPGLEDDIARLLDAADAWDHIISVNKTTAPKLIASPKWKPLAYKAAPYENRADMDKEAVSALLSGLASDGQGQALMVDDPRVAAHLLKRPPYIPVPLPEGLRVPVGTAKTVAALPASEFRPAEHLRPLSERAPALSEAELLALLDPDKRPEERAQTDGAEAYQKARTGRIVERAWAALRLGERGHKTEKIARTLEFWVRNRSLHRDWRYHGLDGASAARALGMLGATEAVPTLVETFLRDDPLLKGIADPKFAQNPVLWTDYRAKMTILPALGALRCPAAKQFLQTYLNFSEKRAREISPPQFAEAAKSLLAQSLTASEIEALLHSPHTEVRGVTIEMCLDHPTPARRAALKAAYPWALTLPSAVNPASPSKRAR